MSDILDFIIKPSSFIFESDEFQDTSLFKEWLLNDLTDNNGISNAEIAHFHLVYSIVQELSQLRFHAEEFYRSNNFLAKDKRRELPLPFDRIMDLLASSQNRHDPPETVISRIAQNHIHEIDAVLGNIRKILRRERELTPIAHVQQIDANCMSWLTRQPGRTPIQKAGAKQKILSIVRKESFNILENRVLKAFLKLCIAYGKRYLVEFQQSYPQSDRIKAVKRLCNTAKVSLQMEEFADVSSLKGQPVPNYVLLHDLNYSIIWRLYLDLLHQTSLMEKAWKKRAALLEQYCYFCFIIAIHQNPLLKTVFPAAFYFASDFKNDNLFIVNSSFREYFIFNERLFQFNLSSIDKRERFGAKIECMTNLSSKRFSVVYLPSQLWNRPIQMPLENRHVYWIFGEFDSLPSQKNIFAFSTASDILITMQEGLNRILGVVR